MISFSSISLGALPSVSSKERSSKGGRTLFSGLGMLPCAVTQVRSAQGENVPGRLALTGCVLVHPDKPSWEVPNQSQHHKWCVRK